MTKPAERKLTQARLKELLHYDPLSGLFTWLVVRGGKHVGDVAGSVCRARGKDYRRIRLDDELIMAHRLAWLYVHGEWPEDELDHEDGDGLNNRISNLRPADRLQNNKNASLRKDNRTGVPGVYEMQPGRFQVTIKHRGQTHYLGRFGDVPAAAAVKKAAEQQFQYHPQHGKPKKP